MFLFRKYLEDVAWILTCYVTIVDQSDTYPVPLGSYLTLERTRQMYLSEAWAAIGKVEDSDSVNLV